MIELITNGSREARMLIFSDNDVILAWENNKKSHMQALHSRCGDLMRDYFNFTLMILPI